jgi:hypothetical protein
VYLASVVFVIRSCHGRFMQEETEHSSTAAQQHMTDECGLSHNDCDDEAKRGSTCQWLDGDFSVTQGECEQV